MQNDQLKLYFLVNPKYRESLARKLKFSDLSDLTNENYMGPFDSAEELESYKTDLDLIHCHSRLYDHVQDVKNWKTVKLVLHHRVLH